MISGLLCINMPPLVRAINHITPFRYSAWLLMNVSFRDSSFRCNSENIVNGVCVSGFTNGEQVLELFKMTNIYDGGIGDHVIILAAMCILLMMGAYYALRYRVYTLSITYIV